jgi:sec-independent protein translocase protein TatA
MFGLGMPELLVIMVIALLVFGAGRLPEIGSSLGKAIKGFKESAEKPEPDEAKPQVKGRVCSKCSAALEAQARFCPSCGNKVETA